jgi:hypothetical protein
MFLQFNYACKQKAGRIKLAVFHNNMFGTICYPENHFQTTANYKSRNKYAFMVIAWDNAPYKRLQLKRFLG